MIDKTHSLLNLPKVIGHRGACGYAPENTIASMLKAHELGTEWIEFDVMLSKDNEIIIMHDETLDKTTGVNALVAESNFSYLRTLDAGSWYAKEYKGEKIPTLKEYLQVAEQYQLGINVEIKPTAARDITTAIEVMNLLKKIWKQNHKIIISSFSLASLETVRAIDPNINMGLLVHEWNFDWMMALKRLNCISLHVNQAILSPAIISQAKEFVHYVLAYTVNDVNRAQELFAWGVDAVFSDYPDRILTF